MIKKYREYLANVCLGFAVIFTAIDKFVIENSEIDSLANFLLFLSILLLIDSSGKNLFWKILHYVFICLAVIIVITQILVMTGLVDESKII